MLEIKEDDKFFTRLLTKESSKCNNNNPSRSSCDSFRVYYGDVPLGVPFLWEAKPGTPKHPSHPFSSSCDHRDLSIPPLTPPPSYALRACDPRAKKVIRTSSFCCKKSKIFNGLGLFPRMIMHRPQISSLSMSSSSSGTDYVPDQTQAQNQTRVERCLLDNDQEKECIKDGEEKDEEEEEEMMRRGLNNMLCFGLGGCRKISSIHW